MPSLKEGGKGGVWVEEQVGNGSWGGRVNFWIEKQ